ncbi:uncharacterized protein LOC134713830 [Mytilus trossulus]|uniref:uncharacterized protein LOC134713830 n=1 Tax=Mytilus trossulus TaxID=6551 RepID=UPI003004A3A5
MVKRIYFSDKDSNNSSTFGIYRYTMFSLAVLFSLILLSEQCCVPSEWEAEQLVTSATKIAGTTVPTVTKSMLKLSWDTPLRRYAFIGSYLSGGKAGSFRTLGDYISNVQYEVLDGKCNVTKIMKPFSSVQCTNANATTSSPVFLGLNQLQVTQYTWQEDGLTNYMNYATGCIPVSYTSFGLVNKDRVYRSGSFENLSVGIKDRSIFNIPPECRGSSLNTLG